jgi:hypothetical protein
MVAPTYSLSSTLYTTLNTAGSVLSGSISGATLANTVTTNSSTGRVEHSSGTGKYGARYSLGGTRSFSDGEFFTMQFKERSGLSAVTAIHIALFDTSGNWAEYLIYQNANTDIPRAREFVGSGDIDWLSVAIAKGATPSASSVTPLSWTGISHIEVFITINGSGARGIRIADARKQGRPTLTNGETGNAGSLSFLASSFSTSNPAWFNTANWDQRVPRVQLVHICGVSLGNGSTETHTLIEGQTIILHRVNSSACRLFHLNASTLPEIVINSGASDNHQISRCVFTGSPTFLNYNFTSQGSGSINVESSTIENTSIVNLLKGNFESTFFINNTYLLFPASTDASLSNCSIIDCGLKIELAGDTSVDLSANTVTISDGKTYDIEIINSAPGTSQIYNIDISSFSQGVGNSTSPTSRIRIDDSTASNIYNITVNSSYTSSDYSSAGATVNIISPVPTLTISGIPAGGIFTIWDDDVSDEQDLGTSLQVTNPTSGADITYEGTTGNAVVFQFIPNTGDSLNYQEFNIPGTIPAASQTLDFSSNLELEVNL